MTIEKLNYNQIEFVQSASAKDNLPPDEGIEIAFAGRSNAGKSSAINTITHRNNLARTSKTPGRTQLINFFRLDDNRHIVDLPGYGYAKVSDKVKAQWEAFLTHYIQHRQALHGIVLMMDIRHPLKAFDWQMIEWVTGQQLPIHILLTKADKLKRGAQKNTFFAVQKELSGYSDFVSIQLFSSHDLTGLDEARTKLDEWFSGQF